MAGVNVQGVWCGCRIKVIELERILLFIQELVQDPFVDRVYLGLGSDAKCSKYQN
jgi:hypothetical protein